jgi:hypothetical protein
VRLSLAAWNWKRVDAEDQVLHRDAGAQNGGNLLLTHCLEHDPEK